MHKHLVLDGQRIDLSVHAEGPAFTVTAGERTVRGERSWLGTSLVLTLAGRTLEAIVVPAAGGGLELWLESERHVIEDERRRGGGGGSSGRARDHAAGHRVEDTVIAPMPAKVLRIAVGAGEAVALGQTLVVLESMKMELAVSAPRAGRVARVAVVPGVMVLGGAELVELEALEEASAP